MLLLPSAKTGGGGGGGSPTCAGHRYTLKIYWIISIQKISKEIVCIPS